MSVLKELAFKLINGLIPLSEAELAEERLKVCEACDDFAKRSRQCKLCWCFMDAKVKAKESECPKGLW